MKKLLILICLSLLTFLLRSNPLPTSNIRFSELYFDNNNKWFLELEYYSYSTSTWIFINLNSKAGNSTLKKYFHCKKGNPQYLILTADSLYSNLNIDKFGDSISFNAEITDSMFIASNATWNVINYPVKNHLVFGNYGTSTIPVPRNGQSITRITPTGLYDGYYCINRIPTIGYVNDTNIYGTLQGHVYDQNNQLMHTGSYYFAPDVYQYFDDYHSDFIKINVKPDGSYSLKIFNAIYNEQLLYDIADPLTVKYNILPLHFTMEPDSVIEKDIHFTSSGIQRDKVNSETVMKFYPNPLSSKSSLHFEIKIPVVSTDCRLLLSDLNGKELISYKINVNEGMIDLPANITAGSYRFQLFINGKFCCASQLIINK